MHRLGAVLAAVALSSCATALHHDLQDIPLASAPSGASVILDCGRGAMHAGVTPMTLTLRRRDSCSVTLQKSDYRDEFIQFHRTIDPAVLGNVIPAAGAAVLASGTNIDVSGSNGTTSGGTVTASASGSASFSPAVAGGVVLSIGVLVDIGSGAALMQTPRRVDVRLEPKR
jgi:hypothetical protein